MSKAKAEKLAIAREYVKQQLQTMRKYGSAPKDLSNEEYWALVYDVAKVISDNTEQK